jgi:hypothetical protein
MPPFAKKAGVAPQQAQRTGFRVPILPQTLPAYTKIKVDHFFDPKTGEPKFYYATSEEEADRLKFIKNPAEIVNRVLARDKPAGYPFTEDDFVPKGTRPGVVAGIPPGKRAFVLSADKVQGIHALKMGDRFDLLGSVPLDSKITSKVTPMTGPDGVQIQNPGPQAKVRVLVQNGALVVAVAIREIPTGSPSMAKGGVPPSKPVQEVTIAVDPQEVAPLHEALATHATLICVARSGRPEDAADMTITPGSQPPPPVHALEAIQGSKRHGGGDDPPKK